MLFRSVSQSRYEELIWRRRRGEMEVVRDAARAKYLGVLPPPPVVSDVVVNDVNDVVREPFRGEDISDLEDDEDVVPPSVVPLGDADDDDSIALSDDMYNKSVYIWSLHDV